MIILRVDGFPMIPNENMYCLDPEIFKKGHIYSDLNDDQQRHSRIKANN